MEFKLHSKYQPTGDQPQTIEKLVNSINAGNREQTLLGVTGSGKTFTMANVYSEGSKTDTCACTPTKLLRLSFAVSQRVLSGKCG